MDLNNLASRLRGGDNAAKEELVSSFGNMVYYTACVECGGHDEALEASKRAFGDLFSDLQGGNVPQDAVAYLQERIKRHSAAMAEEGDIAARLMQTVSGPIGQGAGKASPGASLSEALQGAAKGPAAASSSAVVQTEGVEPAGVTPKIEQDLPPVAEPLPEQPVSPQSADDVPSVSQEQIEKAALASLEVVSTESSKAVDAEGEDKAADVKPVSVSDIEVRSQPAKSAVARLEEAIPEVVGQTQPMEPVSLGDTAKNPVVAGTSAEDLHRQFFGDDTERARRSRVGFTIGVIVACILGILLVWLVIGFLVKLGMLPNIDLGYSWFNQTLYPIF